MKNIFLFLLALLFAGNLLGQADITYTHFMFNKLAYNPAFAGARDALDVTAIYRNQWWSGVDGAPKTMNVNAHAPFFNNKVGLGISLHSDKIGFYNNSLVDLAYAYRIKINDKSKLSLGVQGRLDYLRTDWAEAKGLDLVDNGLNVAEDSKTRLNFGLGAFYNTPDFFIGFSIPQIVKSTYYADYDDFTDVSKITYYLMGGVILPISKQVKFYPAVLLSHNASTPLDVDLNANFLFMDALWLGASYRWDDSIDALIQYQFKNGLKAGVAFDFTASELNNLTTGSYEIMLGYTFQCDDCKIVNLRYF
ncbi:MAG: type IX secretion system membrane protein PorP/SprF [Bacteroidetes bacterium]|nr:type IX secretion system membrane protein PorP/SprF [Bacteroidota bacterium]